MGSPYDLQPDDHWEDLPDEVEVWYGPSSKYEGSWEFYENRQPNCTGKGVVPKDKYIGYVMGIRQMWGNKNYLEDYLKLK